MPERRTLEERLASVGFWLIAGAAALWGLMSLWWPYGWDHGAFGVMADVIHRRGIPYRDVWDIKGPLVPYVYSVLQLGQQMWGVRAFDLLILGASCWSGSRVVSLFAGRRAGYGTVALMVLAFASFGNWYTAQPDGWAGYLLVVVVALLVVPSESSYRQPIAAFIVGLLTTIKPSYAAFAWLVLVAVWPVKREEWPAALRALAISAAAFLTPIAVALAWFGAHRALGDLIDVHLRYNMERVATDPNLKMSFGRIAQLTLSILLNVPEISAAFGGAVFGAAIALRERRRVGIILLSWLAIALVTIAVQHKFLYHNYSWHVVYPPLALLAGMGLGRMWRDAAGAESSRPLRAFVLATVAVLFYQTAKVPLAQAAQWLRYAGGRMSLEQYRATFEGRLPWLAGTPDETVGFSLTRDLRLAAYLRAHTAEDDEIFIWADPVVNHLSDRPSMTPITAPEAFTIWAGESRRKTYQSALIERMQSEKAAIIGVPKFALTAFGSPEFNLATGFPSLAVALAEHYADVGAFEDVELYERKGWRGAFVMSGPR